jgi:hypothetical protein
VILLGRSARNKSCWMSWTMGQDDGAGLVRYANSSANLRIFPAHGLSLHCSRACAAETRSAHQCSLLQDRRAWLHLRCAASALLPHQRPPACMRVVGCLAYTHTCGNELSWPSVLRRASDLRHAALASTSA